MWEIPRVGDAASLSESCVRSRRDRIQAGFGRVGDSEGRSAKEPAMRPSATRRKKAAQV